MKVLITGSNGMLGTDLKSIFQSCHEVYPVDVQDFDITDINDTINNIKNIKPDIILHGAAFTDVDMCESNKDLAFKVNSIGTRNVSVAANEVNASIVYISTDYVYDGKKEMPYYEYDTVNPLSIYGKSKAEGENYIKTLSNKYYIARTSWLYGKNGKNFVSTMLKLSKEKSEIKVVNDQIGSPTYTKDLAKALFELIKKPCYGIYHITNEDWCSWYEFTKIIFEYANINNINVVPISTEELGRPAPRPKNSRLEKYNLMLNEYPKIRSFKEALKEYLKEILVC